jgi:YVTN family beta-propeller protein
VISERVAARLPGIVSILVSFVAGLGTAALAPGSAFASSGYVAIAGSDSVVPLGGGTPITAGDDPWAIAVTPDGKTAYVVDNADPGTVTPIDVAIDKPEHPIPVGTYPKAIAITPNGQFAYVVDYVSNAVTPIDLATGVAQTLISVGNRPVAMAIAPDGRTGYVTNLGDGTVTPIDVATNKPGTPIPAGAGAGAIAITPDGKTAYVADGTPGSPSNSTASVTPINLSTNTPLAPITTAAAGLVDVAITPDGNTAYVTDTTGDLIPIDIATNTTGAPISVFTQGSPPVSGGLAISPDGRTAFVIDACFSDHCGAGSVYAVDLATRTVSPYMQMGFVYGTIDPVAVALVPGPTAPFSATSAPPGETSSFTAAATNPGGTIMSYRWSFGDGTGVVTSTPVVSHVYARPGVYAMSLTTTNQGGCANTFIFTGQTAYCNGSQTASSNQLIDIPAPPTETIASPRPRQRYLEGQTVTTTFSCAETPDGPGLKTCTDSRGNASPHGHLNTSSPGQHVYSVTAVGNDGQSATTSVAYTVAARPSITLVTAHGGVIDGFVRVTLRCSSRRWQANGCRGTLTLASTQVGQRLHSIVLARVRYRVPRGKRKIIELRLTSKALERLQRASDHRIHSRARVTLTNGIPATRIVTLQDL